MRRKTCFVFKRPHDTDVRKFLTYIAKDGNGDERIWLDLAPHQNSTLRTLMANIRKRPELSLVKKVHRFTHANSTELSSLFKEAGMLTPKIEKAIDKVTASCNACASSGRPANTRKISLKNVNKDFNTEVQADFLTVKFGTNKYELLNVVDCSTAYAERSIVNSRSAQSMMSKFEESWMCRHGAPQYFSADPEFCLPFFAKYRNGHGIHVNERPARSSHKNGRVERSNGVFKTVFEKLCKEKTKAGIELLVARSSFISNLIFGRSTVNSFQLARGYLPSIAGLPSSWLTEDILNTHIKMSAYRAIQQASKTRIRSTVPSSMIKGGDTIYIFYESTNKSVKVEWITATVIEAKEHYVECLRSARGRPMRVAYEHIRLVPSDELAKEITESYLEDEIADTDTTGLKTLESLDRDDDSSNAYEDIPGTDTDMDDIEKPRSLDTSTSLMSQLNNPIGNTAKDVGQIESTTTKNIDGCELESTQQLTLDALYRIVGGKQMTRSKMGCAPAWILDKALQEELDSNWADTHDVVDERDVPANANVIPSHVVYRVKTEENSKRRLKARLCRNGNRDKLRKTVRKDSATAQFDIIRLLLSLATI